MRLERAMFELAALAKKADVRNPIRVSISFATKQDHALFKGEIMREGVAANAVNWSSRRDLDEFHMGGVEVRLLS